MAQVLGSLIGGWLYGDRPGGRSRTSLAGEALRKALQPPSSSLVAWLGGSGEQVLWGPPQEVEFSGWGRHNPKVKSLPNQLLQDAQQASGVCCSRSPRVSK